MPGRRQFLRVMAVGTGVGIAGCGGGGNDADGGVGNGGGTPVEATFADDCDDTSALADGTDTAALGVDNTNAGNFERPDGSVDEVRLNRVDSTDDAALAYAPDGDVLDATVEFHWHEEAGGDLVVQDSTDGGESWAHVDAERRPYGGVDASWHHAEVTAEFADGATQARFVLTGGDQGWSPQVGHVTLTVLTTNPDLSTPTPTEAPTPTPSPVSMGTTVDGSADDVVFEHFVETGGDDGTDFAVDGTPVYFGGGNHPQVSRLDGGLGAADWLDTWLDLVPALNVLRVPAFGEGQANYLQPEPGEYNERAFRLLDRVLYRFGSRGVRLVMPVANYWEWRGGIPQYVEWSDAASDRADFYADEQCQGWFRDFLETLLTRENSITGVEYRNDPTVALWELANEPRAGSADYETYHEWVRSSAEFIKSIDGNHLVSTGMEGFYGPDGPAGQDDSRYVETHRIDAVDACSFHLYPDAWGLDPDRGTEWIRTHTRDANEAVGKPSYLGEFGVPVDRLGSDVEERLRVRNERYEEWYAALVEERTDGAMVWDLRTESEYASTSSWNDHAVYPRDEATVDALDQYTTALTGLGGTNS